MSTKPKVGDVRIVTRFALWPTKMFSGERIWLATYKAHQAFMRWKATPPEGPTVDVAGWKTVTRHKE